MPSTCSVPFCYERSGGHKFPRDQVLRQKWIAAIRRINFVPTEYSKVCKKHFTKHDYKLPKESSLKYPCLVLKKESVPSLFSWNENGAGKEKKKTHAKTISIQRCSVLQCKSGSSKNIILHSCPSQEGIRRKWAEVFKVNRDVVKNMLICSQHFVKSDYLNSKNGSTRVLKKTAVPSQKLPRSTRVLSVPKKVVHSKKKERSARRSKMTEVVNQEQKVDLKVDIRECRACLQNMKDSVSVCYIFQSWVPPWTGMETSIARDLAKLANIEILETDNHPDILCEPCYQHLLDAATFAAKVRVSNDLLQQRITSESNSTEKIWPKPIQVDKNINGEALQDFNVEIKQEIVDEEYESVAMDNSYKINDSHVDLEMANLEIKTEPQDFVEPPPLTIMINDTMSLNPLSQEDKTVLNGTGEYEAIITDCVQNSPVFNGTINFEEEQHLDTPVKQEPLSEEEDSELGPDLPLECMLCTKSFNSITGLKAHVIAQHSYKSVKRKSGDSIENKQKDENKCETCRRCFVTSTDLIVHETCHNKYACYGCTRKFDTFKQLTKHRKRCNASAKTTVLKPKTLDDVIRPMKDEKMEVDQSTGNNQEDTNENDMKLHLEIHSKRKSSKTELMNIDDDILSNIKEETT